MKSKKLSPAEWKVMQIIWEKEWCDSRHVYEVTGKKHGWAISTAKTVLRRLVDKGYVKTTRIGNSYLYQPAQSILQPLFLAADDLMRYAKEGTIAPLLAYMVKKSNLNEKDIAELQAMLDEFMEKNGRDQS